MLDALIPVPPETAHDEPWALFRFWFHHIWPKLVPSMLNFCKWKRSFQWYPDQSDLPNGAWNMHEILRDSSEKLRAKFPATTHGYNAFLEVFFNWKQAQ